jgi:type VI protein secretion system component VasK
MIGRSTGANLLLLIAGMVIWGSAFLMLYAALSVGCAFGWHVAMLGPISLLRALLIGLWVLHLALIGGLLLWTYRRRQAAEDGAPVETFFAGGVLHATIVAAVVTVINYAPILGLSLCL